jgi:hypothetical protein
MDNTIEHSNIYTITPNNARGVKDYMLNEQLNQEQQCEDKSNVKKNFIHICTS